MDQITGLPKDYGMNAVLEPLDVKLPAAAATATTAASLMERKGDEAEAAVTLFSKRVTSPPREYSVSRDRASDLPLSAVDSLSCETQVSSPVCSSPRLVDPTCLVSSSSPPDTAFPFTSSAPAVDVPPVVECEPSPPAPAHDAVPATIPATHEAASTEGTMAQVASSVATLTPVEVWVNPFSQLLKSFDEDADSGSLSPPIVSCATASVSPVQVPAAPAPVPVCSRDTRSHSLTSDLAGGVGRDASPSRTRQAKSLASTPDMAPTSRTPHREESGSVKLDERRSSLGSVTSSFKTRTGALLPAIPCQATRTSLREDRLCLRTGSLGEQEFVQQLSSSETQAARAPPVIARSTVDRDDLDFEVDEEYENEGEGSEEDDDEESGGEGDKFTCDTILEETEEDLLSPRPVAHTQTETKPTTELFSRSTTATTTGPSVARLTPGLRGSVTVVSRLCVMCSRVCRCSIVLSVAVVLSSSCLVSRFRVSRSLLRSVARSSLSSTS